MVFRFFLFWIIGSEDIVVFHSEIKYARSIKMVVPLTINSTNVLASVIGVAVMLKNHIFQNFQTFSVKDRFEIWYLSNQNKEIHASFGS